RGGEIIRAAARTRVRRRSHMNPRQVLAAIAIALILLVDTAAAQSAASRLEGRLPETTPLVSIDQPRGTVLDALDALATQAGFGLVVSAPESLTARPLAIRVVKQPAGEALQLILEAGDLRAAFASGVLKVQSDAPAGSGESARARRYERFGRR